MGGCQRYDPFLGTLNIRGRIIIGTQKGTIILTTTHIGIMEKNMETTRVTAGKVGQGAWRGEDGEDQQGDCAQGLQSPLSRKNMGYMGILL